MTDGPVSRVPLFEVVSPLGQTRGGPQVQRTYLPTLNGKNIAFLWDYLFKGPQMFEYYAAVIREQFPEANFVSFEVFGNIHGSAPDEKANVAAIRQRMSRHEVHAAIVAVGA